MIKLTFMDNETFVWVNVNQIQYCYRNEMDLTRLAFGAGENFICVKEDVSYVIAEIERAKEKQNDKNLPC